MSVPFLYHEVPEAPENGAFLMLVFGTVLARMIGHADIRELNTYYNATAEDIAKYL